MISARGLRHREAHPLALAPHPPQPVADQRLALPGLQHAGKADRVLPAARLTGAHLPDGDHLILDQRIAKAQHRLGRQLMIGARTLSTTASRPSETISMMSSDGVACASPRNTSPSGVSSTARPKSSVSGSIAARAEARLVDDIAVHGTVGAVDIRVRQAVVGQDRVDQLADIGAPSARSASGRSASCRDPTSGRRAAERPDRAARPTPRHRSAGHRPSARRKQAKADCSHRQNRRRPHPNMRHGWRETAAVRHRPARRSRNTATRFPPISGRGKHSAGSAPCRPPGIPVQ